MRMGVGEDGCVRGVYIYFCFVLFFESKYGR